MNEKRKNEKVLRLMIRSDKTHLELCEIEKKYRAAREHLGSRLCYLQMDIDEIRNWIIKAREKMARLALKGMEHSSDAKECSENLERYEDNLGRLKKEQVYWQVFSEKFEVCYHDISQILREICHASTPDNVTRSSTLPMMAEKDECEDMVKVTPVMGVEDNASLYQSGIKGPKQQIEGHNHD